MTPTLGARIRGLREARSLTQVEVADHLGVSQTAVSYWEKGRRVPSVAMLARLAGLLGVTIDELIDGWAA